MLLRRADDDVVNQAGHIETLRLPFFLYLKSAQHPLSTGVFRDDPMPLPTFRRVRRIAHGDQLAICEKRGARPDAIVEDNVMPLADREWLSHPVASLSRGLGERDGC